MKSLNFLLLFTSVFFVALNFYAFEEFSTEGTRWVRLLGTVSFFFIALSNKYSRNIISLVIFLLLLLSDFCLVYYEHINFKILQFIFRGAAYLAIGIYALKYLKHYSLSKFQKVLIVLIISINFFLLYSIASSFHNAIESTLSTILFYFQGTTALLLLAIAAIFISEIINAVELSFFLCAIGFIMTDLAAFSAHHLDFLDFFIVSRSLYIMAVGSFIKYASYPDKFKILRSSYKN